MPTDPSKPRVRLAVIGDLHGHVESLRRVLALAVERECQGLLLVGDFEPGPYAPSVRAGRSDAEVLADTFAALAATGLPALWVPGNHDHRGMPQPGNVDGRRETLLGLRVVGIGGAGPARFGFPYEWGEDQIRALDLPEADILLCHAPPQGTALDRLAYGGHAGSIAIHERALRQRGVLLCGHIHEAAGIERLGDCLCLNAGSLGEPFARLQWGWIDWREDGIEIGHEDLERGRIVRQEILPPATAST